MSDEQTLAQERDFLVRSLDDLETERAAGNVDDATYERLHSDYTARAAAVVRALRDGVDTRPRPPRSSTRLGVLTVGGVVVFAVVAGLLLAYSLGARLPGQTVTGNGGAARRSAGVSLAQREADFRAAVGRSPNDVNAQLALARLLLGERKFPEALRRYDTAARLDPSLPEPKAYGGWIVFLGSEQADASQRGRLLDDAQARLTTAVTADEAYPDAHFFLGMLLFRGRDDPAGAIPELQRYLALAPDAPQSAVVRQVLLAAGAATGTTSRTP